MEVELELKERSDLVWIGTTEVTEAESEEKETLLTHLTPIPLSFQLRFRFLFLIYSGS